MAEEPKLGTLRYQAQTWPLRDGDFAWLIRIHKRVQFKRSKRVGWKSLGWVSDKGGRAPTRLEAQRAARAAIGAIDREHHRLVQEIIASDTGKPADRHEAFYARREELRREALAATPDPVWTLRSIRQELDEIDSELKRMDARGRDNWCWADVQDEKRLLARAEALEDRRRRINLGEPDRG